MTSTKTLRVTLDDIPAVELAAAYHERWEAELVFDELKTQCPCVR